MKKIIYFSSICLLMIFTAFATNDTTAEPTMVVEICDDDFDLSGISLEDLDKLEEAQSLSFSQKMDAFFSIILFQITKTKQIAGEKLEIAKNHISEHQKGYAIGFAVGAAATISFIIWLNRHRLFSAPTIT